MWILKRKITFSYCRGNSWGYLGEGAKGSPFGKPEVWLQGKSRGKLIYFDTEAKAKAKGKEKKKLDIRQHDYVVERI
jgi:hypothetical protein